MRTKSLLRFRGKWIMNYLAHNGKVEKLRYFNAHINWARDQLIKKGKKKSGWLKGNRDGNWY